MRNIYRAGANSCHLLKVSMLDGRFYFGINVMKIEHILAKYKFVPVPSDNFLVPGCIEWGQHLIPAISIARLLHQDIHNETNSKAIIVNMLGFHFAILVQEVEQVHYLSWDQIHPLLSTNATVKAIKYLNSIARGQNGLVLPVLDLERILSDHVIEMNLEQGNGRSQAGFLIGQNILYAEDSPLVRDKVVRELEKAGATVHSTNNGREALDLAKTLGGARISLVITDIEMPEMDGFTLIRSLRSIENFNSPIGIFTSLSHKLLSEQAAQIGADFVITKYDHGILLDRLSKIILTKKDLIST